MYKIFVGNLSFETTEEDLRKVFETRVDIEDIAIARDAESGKSKGYGFVMTRDAIRGRRAVAQVGKFFVDGRLAYAKEAHNGKKPPKRRGGSRRVSHRPKPMRRKRDADNGSDRTGGYSATAAGQRSAEPASRGYVGMDQDAAPSSPPPGNARQQPHRSR